MHHYSKLSALDLSLAVQQGEVTVVELSQYFIQRIKDHDELNCISQLLTQRALQQATRLDQLAAQGIYLSPLHGVPMIVKDSFAISGEVTWAGTTYLNQLEQQDAAIITQLEALGLVIVARAKMTELAFGLSGQNPIQGTPRNPCYAKPVAPGGSSSGCAVAVAAGLAPLAVGGDTGGSVRVPAAMNGILGFKPSHDQLNGQGNLPLAASLDSVGLMARSSEDLLELYTQLRPVAETFHPNIPIYYLSENHFPESLEPEVYTVWQAQLHHLQQQGYALTAWQPPQDFNFQQLSDWCSDIIAYEGYQLYHHLADDENTPMWSIVRHRIQRGAQISAPYYQSLITKRNAYYAAFAASLDQQAALLLPMLPGFAPPLNAEDSSCHTVGPYSRPFNYLDLPACSFPIGYARQHEPIAAQLVMLKGQEISLLQQVQQIIRLLNLPVNQLAKKIPS